MDFDKTMSFQVEREENTKTKEILKEVYEALTEKGYNPINQIVGYLISGDPGYISSYRESRKKICKLERTQIIEVLLRNYSNKYWDI